MCSSDLLVVGHEANGHGGGESEESDDDDQVQEHGGTSREAIAAHAHTVCQGGVRAPRTKDSANFCAWRP